MATPQGGKAAKQKKDPQAVKPQDAQPRRIGLRMARASDTTPLWNMLRHYFDEFLSFYPAPDEMATIAWGLNVIHSGAVVLAFEVSPEGVEERMVACMGLERGAHPWAPRHQYFNTVWFYVIPERRKGGTANHLVKAAKAIAAENGMPLRMDYVWGGPDTAKQDRYREIMGLTFMGSNYGWIPPAKAAS